MCRRGLMLIVRAMCVSAHAYSTAHVYVCVRACSWKHRWCLNLCVRVQLAWHVRVILPVMHVHARMDARMRVCACCARA